MCTCTVGVPSLCRPPTCDAVLAAGVGTLADADAADNLQHVGQLAAAVVAVGAASQPMQLTAGPAQAAAGRQQQQQRGGVQAHRAHLLTITTTTQGIRDRPETDCVG